MAHTVKAFSKLSLAVSVGLFLAGCAPQQNQNTAEQVTATQSSNCYELAQAYQRARAAYQAQMNAARIAPAGVSTGQLLNTAATVAPLVAPGTARAAAIAQKISPALSGLPLSTASKQTQQQLRAYALRVRQAYQRQGCTSRTVASDYTRSKSLIELHNALVRRGTVERY